MLSQLKTACLFFVLLTLLTGILYPMAVTGVAQLFFPFRANGSCIVKNGQLIGSQLIGQWFFQSKYFWGRPSATQPFPYNGANSSGSNFGPMNEKFLSEVKARIAHLNSKMPIPVDLVTASASGLDPDISPHAAYFQVSRIAAARKIPEDQVRALIKEHIRGRTLSFLGEPRVNVLELNLALDALGIYHG